MIGYLEGKLLKKGMDRILLVANQVGYEVQLPGIVMDTLRDIQVGEIISLFIYYHQTERQPKPVLIGFNDELEKEFFQLFLSVEAIGPLKAVKAFNIPLYEIANAIEAKDVNILSSLKGIGKRTAQKIIATLEGKVQLYTTTNQPPQPISATENAVGDQVLDVLIDQLGHKPSEAKLLIVRAFERNKTIATPEALLDEIYRGETHNDQ